MNNILVRKIELISLKWETKKHYKISINLNLLKLTLISTTLVARVGPRLQYTEYFNVHWI